MKESTRAKRNKFFLYHRNKNQGNLSPILLGD